MYRRDITASSLSLSLSLVVRFVFLFLLHDGPWAEHDVADEREASREADRFA